MIVILYPVCYHECTAVNWRETLSPQTSQFTLGMNQGKTDVIRCLGEQDSAGVMTGMPAVPLKERERRDWLRGYVTGMLQQLTDSRSAPAPVTEEEEGARH
jgi:hypothetical protein